MTFGTIYERGEILIVPFPFSDLSSIKQRPVVVLSKKEYNSRTEDIITCGITSNLKDSENSVILENKNLSKGQIPVTSRVKVDKLFTLDKSIVRKSIGKINTVTFEEIKKEFVNLV
ncbi:MAG: type II toxin-antitoxin system PemK/MazF family toxin [Nanoarchaeota archaeon]